MNSRKLLWVSIWSVAALPASAPRTSAGLPVRVSQPGDEPVVTCSDLNIHFEDRPAVMQSEERTISKGEAPTLRIQAEATGGLQVLGSDKDSYSVTLCKAADSGGNAEVLLSKIHLTFQNGELGVFGPSSHDRWTAHLLVNAPRAASLELQVNNGPLSLLSVDGNVKVRARNGPVTVKSCAGTLDLDAQNGPVSLDGNSGMQHVDAQNGPVTLSLKGTSWNGSGIVARANNGPLALHISSGYQSEVRVESDGHSPFACQASVCSEGRKTWEDDRKSIEFGPGPTMIRLSTRNGPISIN